MTYLLLATLVLALLIFAAAAAHVMELPGKMRLDREAYLHTQTIYFPGFTLAGIAEPVSILCAGALLWLVSPTSPAHLPILIALIGLAGLHLVYWMLTHPVNGFWLSDEEMGVQGKAFFGSGNVGQAGWRDLRNRWEYSHVIRAVLAVISLAALLVALAVWKFG